MELLFEYFHRKLREPPVDLVRYEYANMGIRIALLIFAGCCTIVVTLLPLSRNVIAIDLISPSLLKPAAKEFSQA